MLAFETPSRRFSTGSSYPTGVVFVAATSTCFGGWLQSPELLKKDVGDFSPILSPLHAFQRPTPKANQPPINADGRRLKKLKALSALICVHRLLDIVFPDVGPVSDPGDGPARTAYAEACAPWSRRLFEECRVVRPILLAGPCAHRLCAWDRMIAGAAAPVLEVRSGSQGRPASGRTPLPANDTGSSGWTGCVRCARSPRARTGCRR